MLAAGVPDVAGTPAAAECVRLAQAHPAEFDIHRWSASVVFDKREVDVVDTDEVPERYHGKRTMHAFMRGVGAQRMSDELLKEGWVITPEECGRRLAKLDARLPAIREGYFKDIERQLMRYRGLGNTWGGLWRCDYARFEEHLYGVGYSYQPVSEAVALLNQCGFIPLANAIRLREVIGNGRPTPAINVHGHDSLLISVHPEDAWAVAAFLDRTLGRATRRYAAGELCVPVTYKLGRTWKGDVEYNRLPSAQEFRDAAWACEEASA